MKKSILAEFIVYHVKTQLDIENVFLKNNLGIFSHF